MSSAVVPPAVVAAFDLDGTLTDRDCVTPFLRRVAGPALRRRIARSPAAFASAALRRDNDRLKALATEALRGLRASDVAAEGVSFAREVHAQWLRDDTLARLERHRALGHTTVIVSASYEPYVAPLGTLLGVDGVLCTRLAVGDAGLLTGRLEGENCRGPEKERRLRGWLAERSLGGASVWAYGDSEGDRELLALADHPVYVRDRTIDAEPTGDARPEPLDDRLPSERPREADER